MVAVQALYSDLSKLYNDLNLLSFKQTELLKTVMFELDKISDDELLVQDDMLQLEAILESREQLSQDIDAVHKQIAVSNNDGLPALEETQRQQIISTIEEIIANDELNQKLGAELQSATQSKIGTIRKNEKAHEAYNHVLLDPWFVDSKK